MKILVLGGTGFVGRTLATCARDAGHHVTVLNRGHRPALDGVHHRTGDRLRDDGLDTLGHDTYDRVVDTWAGDPTAVTRAATTLSGRAGHYTYISSRSVYTPSPPPITEDAPLVDTDTDFAYARDKLLGEHAAATFDGPVLHARAGLILGPCEDVGRLPWWLHRLHRGGPTLAPGPADLPLQYIDARDLAAFLLGPPLTGAYNIVSPPAHTTMGELLTIANHITGGHADLRWTPPDVITDAGIAPWTELPLWIPPGPDHAFMHGADVTRALNAGLTARPVHDTVTDTWTWLNTLDGPPPRRTDRGTLGLDPDTEARILSRSATR